MKIAILTPTFSYYSGIDRVVERQAIDYAKKGSKVTIFTLEAHIKPRNFKLEVLGMPKSPLLKRLYRLIFFLDYGKIKSTAEKLKDYDLVVSHFYPMNWIAYCAKKRYDIRYVYYNHGIGHSHLFTNIFERTYMRLFAFLNKLSIMNADSIISISKFLQKELKKETGKDSKVIYNKIDTKKFKKNIDGSKIRKQLGIKNNEKLLFFIGRLSPHKNVHALLKIFDVVNQEIPNARLLIVGDHTFPGYFKKLKSMANKNVIFKESVDDKEIPYYYAACDLYVTASLWEGFNLPVAEAQACGKKVVVFAIGAHPEIVKNGILVKENDTEGFADAVVKLLK